MLKIACVHNTFLTKEPVSADATPNKIPVRPGKEYQVDSIGELKNGKRLVKLAYGQGDWWIFPAHWLGLNRIPPQAVAIIKEFEGCELHPYDDGVGVWTIGIGTTRYPDGRAVAPNDPPITVADAEHYLEVYLESMLPKLQDIPGWDAMSDGKKSALISFAYNCGDFYHSDGFESLNNALRRKDWAAVPSLLLLYVNPGTSTEVGLRRRRVAEGKLWNS